MTIASETNRVSFTGNGVTTDFAFSAPYRASSDFTVIQRVVATGVETVKALTTDYTISGVANTDTGGFDSMTLTMLVAPPTGTTLHIIRKVPPTSSYDPTAGAADTAPSREGSADRAVLAIQGVKDITRRALLQPETAANLDLVLPEPTEDVSGYVLAVNGDGDAYELFTPADLDLAAVSAYALGLLADASAAEALATLGLVGKQTIWIPAAAMTSRTTNGAAPGTTESSSNKVMNKTLDFDTTTAEYAQFNVAFPKSWDEGTVTFQAFWTAASGSGTAIFSLAGVALSNDDAIDTAFGSAITVTDTLLTALDIHVSPESAAVTIAGTPASDDIVYFQVSRDISDSLGVDAKLIGIKLFYTNSEVVDD